MKAARGAFQAAELMSHVASPLDRLGTQSVSADDRLVAGPMDSVVAVFGEQRLRQWAAVRSLAWSPDGKWLASSGDEESVRLWNAATGKQSRRFESPAGLLEHRLSWEVNGSPPLIAKGSLRYGTRQRARRRLLLRDAPWDFPPMGRRSPRLAVMESSSKSGINDRSRTRHLPGPAHQGGDQFFDSRRMRNWRPRATRAEPSWCGKQRPARSAPP